jgi:opacity protein-like surface antigen
MKQIVLVAVVILSGITGEAQVIIGGGFGGGFGRGFGRGYYQPRPPRQRRHYQELPEFKPSLNVSVGYGFPNLDANQFPDYYRYYQGNPTYGGPINAAIDYRFTRNASLGMLVTTGHASVKYYDYNTGAPAMTGSLTNWSFMLNFMRYMPVSSKVITPYIRTALGINSYTQNFTDASTGDKIAPPQVPSSLAYQVGIGAQFNVVKKMALFAEAGYGKYILNAGVTFKL